jgi:predicted CXXCH cytochrome family protein
VPLPALPSPWCTRATRLPCWACAVAAALLASLALLLASTNPANAAPFDELHGKTCTSAGCHPQDLGTPGVISHPSFLEGWCDRCHTDHTQSTPMLLKADPAELCLQCHEKTETHERAVQHPPGGQTCVDCHSPHQGSVRHLLRDEDMLLDCSRCHAEDLAEAQAKPFRHRFFNPVSECGSCHYAHQGSEGGYLRENLGETCLTCHEMSIRVEGRNLESVGQVIQKATNVHQPLKDFACHACHTPHGSLQPSLLRDDYPAGNYASYQRENYQLCWNCHDAGLVESAETRADTGFRDGSRNLHSLHVMQSKRGRACHICHSAHASERSHLLRETIRFESWDGDFLFDELPEGGRCTTACHRPMEYDRSSPN